MELFTNFVIESIPQVEFAHTYETDNYAFSFPIREDFLEISYFEESDATLESENGKKVHIPSNSIYFHYSLNCWTCDKLTRTGVIEKLFCHFIVHARRAIIIKYRYKM